MSRPAISVIIPALNEEAIIASTLGTLDAASGGIAYDVIVADGGSVDGTVRIAQSCGARMVPAPRGRGAQMNAGASAASGGVLVFLHADCVLPPGAFGMIMNALPDGAVSAGAFDIAIAARGAAYRLIERMANLRSRIARVPYGDQALFMRASTFRAIGGFREMPLMEDVEIASRLKRAGRIDFQSARVAVSARRWKAEGPLRTTLRDWSLILAYSVLGVSPEKLARHYADIR